MTERTMWGGSGDTSGLSSGTGRPAEATFGVSGAARSAGHGDPDGQVPVGDHGAASSGPDAASRAVAPESTPSDTELLGDLGAELPLGRDELAEAFEALQAEAVEWREKGMRVQAEYENTRKRLEQRHADALLRAGERVVEALFPVMDDLERAIDHAGEHPDVAEGLNAVHRKLAEVIGREGCIAIDPAGVAFDPERHNAVQVREDDSVPDHTVVDVFQRGYEMHGRVLRPAMVVVSSGGPTRGE